MTGPARQHAAAAVSGQDEILAFLGRGAARIDTHASVVFLASDRALKVKRAVKLPFLDYSTLEKRRRACEEELAVNARNAPEIYRRVVAITRDAGGLAIDGKGAPVEWAVEMARFDERRALDHLAAARTVPPDAADQLAEAMRISHARAPVGDGAPWLASLGPIIDRNTAQFRGQAELSGGDVEHLHRLSHDRLRDLLPLLRRRAEAGCVRRCHGDAHLANIVMIDDKPVLFDAIEFDPVIATIDMLYDLAFPVMDFLHYGDKAAANRLLNGYLLADWRTHGDALGLLPLFLSIRAAIRALVSFTKHDLCPDDPACLADARSYFALALRLIAPGKPSLVAIGGRSGTGKSVLARAIAGTIGPLPGAVLLRSDVIRKELAGVDPLTRLPPSTYTHEGSEQVYGEMFDRARKVLAQGCSAIVDAAFLTEAKRSAAAATAQAAGVDFQGLFLTADTDVRAKRIGLRRNDASDATEGIARLQGGADAGEIRWPLVDADGTPEQTRLLAKPLLKRLQT